MKIQLHKGGHSEAVIRAHGGRTLFGGRKLSGGFKKKKVPQGYTLVFYGPDRAEIQAGSLEYEFVVHNHQANPHKEKAAGDSYVDYGLASAGNKGNEIAACLGTYDVIDLVGSGEIMLSRVLEMLQQTNVGYSKIHCLFCRCFTSGMLDFIKGRRTVVTPT